MACDTSSVVDWLMWGARSARQAKDIMGEMCERLVACGVPLWRAAVFVRTLHPQITGRRFLWRIGGGVEVGELVFERLGTIRADERKVKQVLLNLLSNALKFTPEGGRIDVRAGQQEGAAELAVTDTGVGIAPEDQEAVFEEFRQVGTAAKKVEGTGLGLALSRKFIELHGGRIWVKSRVGEGSTFTFTLPLRLPEAS